MSAGGDFAVPETTIEDIHAAYRAGTLTAGALVGAYLDRIEAYDRNGPAINAIVSVNSEAEQQAARLDAEFARGGPVGPLHGIPVIVKDQADVDGMPTTMGSVLFKDHYPGRDCFVAARLREAGAIILAKSTLGEMGAGDTHGSLFGSTRNVYDLARTAGGSSGGSGAAVSANLAAVAIGQEGFASIRRPATWNGVVGMRPTAGLVSRGGVYAGWPMINGSLGPMCRTVADAARLLDVMAGYDPADPITARGVGRAPESYAAGLDKDALKGARIGILREPMGFNTEPASDDFAKVDAVFDRAVQELAACGAELVDPVVIPDLAELLATRVNDREEEDASFREYVSGLVDPPFSSREEAMASPLYAEDLPRRPHPLGRRCRRRSPARVSCGARKADDQPSRGHGGPPARRHRPQGGGTPADPDRGRRQPALRRPEGRALPQHLRDLRALDRGSGGLHLGRVAGRHHVSRPRLRRCADDPLRLRLRTGDAAPETAAVSTLEPVRRPRAFFGSGRHASPSRGPRRRWPGRKACCRSKSPERRGRA